MICYKLLFIGTQIVLKELIMLTVIIKEINIIDYYVILYHGLVHYHTIK